MSRADLSRIPLSKVIDRESFVPSYLSLISNAYLLGGSKIYLERFDVSSPDFAILSALSNHPGAVASEISQIVALDKSVVSRRLKTLIARNLVALEMTDGQFQLFLTEVGVAVHDQVMPVALDREDRLLKGFSEDEEAQLRDYLKRMLVNVAELDSQP